MYPDQVLCCPDQAPHTLWLCAMWISLNPTSWHPVQASHVQIWTSTAQIGPSCLDPTLNCSVQALCVSPKSGSVNLDPASDPASCCPTSSCLSRAIASCSAGLSMGSEIRQQGSGNQHCYHSPCCPVLGPLGALQARWHSSAGKIWPAGWVPLTRNIWLNNTLEHCNFICHWNVQMAKYKVKTAIYIFSLILQNIATLFKGSYYYW